MDTGPVVLTMTEFIDDAFRAAGSTLAEHITLRPVDPMYRAVFHDGSELRVRRGREAMTEEIRAFAGDKDAAAFGMALVLAVISMLLLVLLERLKRRRTSS